MKYTNDEIHWTATPSLLFEDRWFALPPESIFFAKAADTSVSEADEETDGKFFDTRAEAEAYCKARNEGGTSAQGRFAARGARGE